MWIRDHRAQGMKKVLVLHILRKCPRVQRHCSRFKLTFEVVYRRIHPAKRIYEVFLLRILHGTATFEAFASFTDLVQY